MRLDGTHGDEGTVEPLITHTFPWTYVIAVNSNIINIDQHLLGCYKSQEIRITLRSVAMKHKRRRQSLLQ